MLTAKAAPTPHVPLYLGCFVAICNTKGQLRQLESVSVLMGAGLSKNKTSSPTPGTSYPAQCSSSAPSSS